MREQAASSFDFDRWAALARDDPAAFEAMRRAAIDAFIDSAPPDRQERLRRLQWRIDHERRRAASPLAGCIRISRMMWDSLVGRGGLRERLLDLGAAIEVLHGGEWTAPTPSGCVLPFPARPRGTS
ncbi:MAG: DUF3135 domain-containing protein [Gammaproteobacteria bacterium]|jgi:hypothetical protein|nr:DUF3135 domain-containing protein [Gammaproteobacteria bacterium]